jgi:signal transduction histidine kinase
MAKKRGDAVAPAQPKRPRKPRPGLSSALKPAEWPLRRKVALAVLLPLALAAVLGGLRVQEDRSRASDFADSASQVTVLRPAVAYLQAVETAIITGRGVTAMANGAALDATIEDVIEAAGEFEDAAARADLTPEQSTRASEVLRLSEQLRSAQGYASVGQSISQLRQLQRGVNQLVSAIAAAQAEPEPMLQLLGNLIDGRVSLTVQLFTAATVDTGKEINPVDLGAEVGVEAGAVERIAGFLSIEDPDVRRLRSQNATRLGTVRGNGTGLGGEEAYAPYDRLTDDVLTQIDTDLAAARDDANLAALIDIIVVVVALVMTLLVALVVSRLLLEPLRKVREGTLRVAQESLPRAVRVIRSGGDPGDIVPIDISTNEEIGELARAVDGLHSEAVKLAVREAKLADQIGEMFVTLSRRSTSLINQQLGLIDKLEKDEEDPERLESLFRLDHLASRMRRTADSLNILADAPAAATDSRGLSVGDVLHASIAGVQDYQRVDIDSSATEFISGAAASDVVHLVTELTDNALSFSPPTSRVQVISKRLADGVVIQVVDAGLGMKPEMLESLNDELRSGGEVTPETARRMGMLVVSRLAKRHGITVELQRSSRGGVAAYVTVPATILRTTAQPGPAVTGSAMAAHTARVSAVPAPVQGGPGASVGGDVAATASTETRPLSALAAFAAETTGEDAGGPARGAAAPALPTVPDKPAEAAPAARAAASPSPTRQAAPAPDAVSVPGPVAVPRPAAGSPEAEAEKKSALAARLQSMREARAASGLNNPGAGPNVRPGVSASPTGLPPAAAGAGSNGAATPSTSIEDAINAVIRPQGDKAQPATPTPPAAPMIGGLPRRNPGTSDVPGLPLQPLTPPRGATPVPGPGSPDGGAPAAPVAPEVNEPPAELVAEPVAEPVAELVATADTETPTTADAAVEAPVEVEAAPAMVGSDALSGASILDPASPLPAAALTDEGSIFASMKSSWFDSGADDAWASDEVDQGWSRADQVTVSEPSEIATTGLPVRRPGSRVVPGGVSAAAPVAPVRDPEAIRARLAAHSAGVNRGRSKANNNGDGSSATAVEDRPHDHHFDPSQESDPT